MNLLVLRHGPTASNRRHAYIGATDEPLDEQGRREVAQSRAEILRVVDELSDTPPTCVFVSPMQRARQTADILFPDLPQIAIDGMGEYNFGDFEGKNYQDMADDPSYRAWVDTDCTAACPNGDSRASYATRSVPGLIEAIHQAAAAGEDLCVVVAHGGTVMTGFTELSDSDRDYFAWRPRNCGGASARVEFITDAPDGAPDIALRDTRLI